MICAGIDTHKDAHVLAIADELGREISHASFASDRAGIEALAHALGDPAGCLVCGIEGTGSYGAGVAGVLMQLGFRVVEVSRPRRADLSRVRDKNDASDALRAAKRALAGEGVPAKAKGGDADAMRALRCAHAQAVRLSTAASNSAKGLLISASQGVRERFSELSGKPLMRSLCRKRRSDDATEQAVLDALRALAKMWREAESQRSELVALLEQAVEETAPSMLEMVGCAAVGAADLISMAGDDPSRIEGEAEFARMCGVAPVEASSGRVVRHRLDRRGCRQANRALHTMALTRMRTDERTIRYVARRTEEGLSKPEIIRCLKRYICREVYRTLIAEERRRASC